MGVENMPELKEALEMAIKALEREPKTEHWIPVSERLPEDKQKVIFTNKKNEIGWGIYHKSLGFLGDGIIAWMPLTIEPYKASPTGAESEEVC